MAGFRAYFDFKNFTEKLDGQITLSPEESRHLCGSLRAKVGDDVDAFDLNGNICKCKILDANPKKTTLSIGQKVNRPERETEIYLLQCLPKGKTFDDIIRQSVELGVAGIFPIISQFSQVKIDTSEAEKKRAKWEAQVIEAVKQSSNFSGFEIFKPTTFKQLFANLPQFDLKIVASLQANAVRISKAFANIQKPKKVAVLIGPEGDLSPTEYQDANNADFKPITLGKNVLKSETAAISCISQVIASLDFIE